jgi:hypothetical protein
LQKNTASLHSSNAVSSTRLTSTTKPACPQKRSVYRVRDFVLDVFSQFGVVAKKIEFDGRDMARLFVAVFERYRQDEEPTISWRKSDPANTTSNGTPLSLLAGLPSSPQKNGSPACSA